MKFSKIGALSAAGALGLGIVAAPTIRRTMRVAAQVPPELRSPAMFVPLPAAAVSRAQRRVPIPKPDPAKHGARRVVLPAGGPEAEAEFFVHDHGRGRGPGRGHGVGAPAIVWFHGGGHVLGSAEFGLAETEQLARDIEGVVVAVAYRLSPKHPFPAALDDGMRALRWVHEHAADLGVDPARVAVGGESAGGGLAAATAQRAHDEGVPVCFQALVYPMLDDRTVLRAEGGDEWALLWTPPANRYGWTAYLGHEPGRADTSPYAVPARRVDLRGLPPAWIGVGTLDLFHAEDVDYAHRLRAADVAVELHEVEGMWHANQRFAQSAAMRDFERRIVDAIRRGTAA